MSEPARLASPRRAALAFIFVTVMLEMLGIAGLIAPGLFTQTFAIFIDPLRDWGLPGAPFLLAAILVAAAMALALRVTRPREGPMLRALDAR